MIVALFGEHTQVFCFFFCLFFFCCFILSSHATHSYTHKTVNKLKKTTHKGCDTATGDYKEQCFVDNVCGYVGKGLYVSYLRNFACFFL